MILFGDSLTLKPGKVYHSTVIEHGISPRIVRVDDVLVVCQKITESSAPATVQQIKCDAMYVEFGDSNGKPSPCVVNLPLAYH